MLSLIAVPMIVGITYGLSVFHIVIRVALLVSEHRPGTFVQSYSRNFYFSVAILLPPCYVVFAAEWGREGLKIIIIIKKGPRELGVGAGEGGCWPRRLRTTLGKKGKREERNGERRKGRGRKKGKKKG